MSKPIKTSLQMPVELWTRVKVHAATERKAVRSVVIEALHDYLSARDEKPRTIQRASARSPRSKNT